MSISIYRIYYKKFDVIFFTRRLYLTFLLEKHLLINSYYHSIRGIILTEAIS